MDTDGWRSGSGGGVVNLATRRFAIESTPETGAGFMLATLVGTLTAGVSGSQRESAGVSGSQRESVEVGK